MDTTTSATAVRISFIALSLLLSWRLWRFTIRPRLHPDEPKELPYWIPFIGHVFSFFVDFNGAIEKGRKHFSPSRDPFAMTVAGQTIYVLTSPDDISGVWKNSKTISIDPITMDMYILGGISGKSREVMFHQHPTARYNEGTGRPLTPTQMAIELHHQQLHAGLKLDSLLQDKVIPSCFKKLDMADAMNTAILSRSEDSVIISLHDLCVDIFVTEVTQAYFGPALLQKSPNLISAFLNWEYCSWKFLFMLPDILARDMTKTKRTIIEAFANYYRQPRTRRPGSIYFVDSLEDMLAEVGLTTDEMGKFTLLHYWAVVGNLYKLTFWLMSHLGQNPGVLDQIREEVSPAVHGERIDEAYLLERCPKLSSVISETLRLTVTSALARVILEPTAVGGKLLKPGTKIMLSIRELHYDAEVWGTKSDALDANRFIDNPKMSKSPSYRPWGGGHTLCPGRLFARRSANAFVAILLTKYDVAVESTTFPRADGGRPSPGIVTLGQGEDLKVRLIPRNSV
ncbi:hypothetical protein HBI56_209870 [Parastagonospora nodorum]|nr:hypothetical protein HBH52_233240 [Parastagonospora nodorum]KAH3991609.1 hypothetical protein HBI10_230630 [Parastagonospora nodorum]KAH4087884.1 hypothetical protein HBH46_198440 [Parastagonospora nodorum]KAH4693230.1 hypothetical protein HBH67_225830 [Parastagonospora nodorum]KAH4757858.1 hypothetical protein HBH63_226040 [Parastagonospora nodorum]